LGGALAVANVRSGPSLEQVNLILGTATEPRGTQFAVLAFTGMRSGELQHLQRLDLEANWLHIVSRPGAKTKTRETWKVPVHPRLLTLLEARPKTRHSWVFTAGASNRYPSGEGHNNVYLLFDQRVCDIHRRYDRRYWRRGDRSRRAHCRWRPLRFVPSRKPGQFLDIREAQK